MTKTAVFGGLKAPDITPAQIVAGVTWVGGEILAMGLIDNNTNQHIVEFASTAIPAAWIVADSIIRLGRAKAVAAFHAASAPRS